MFIWHFITGLLKSIKICFLRIFGKIRINKYPMWIQYDPKGYEVDGPDIRYAMSILKPGDILCRRYNGFLDGWFIPGRFSHSGIYIGDGLVVHAMGEGVSKIDIIDFLRCDGFAILRCNTKDEAVREEIAAKACKIAKSYVGYSYDFDFDICEDYNNQDEVQKRTKSIYCHELTRSCYPTLNIPVKEPSLWNGMIRSKKKQFLAQSFFDSPDLDLIHDSDYCDPRCTIK